MIHQQLRRLLLYTLNRWTSKKFALKISQKVNVTNWDHLSCYWCHNVPNHYRKTKLTVTQPEKKTLTPYYSWVVYEDSLLMHIIWDECMVVNNSLDWRFPSIKSLLLRIMMDIMAHTYNMFCNLWVVNS